MSLQKRTQRHTRETVSCGQRQKKTEQEGNHSQKHDSPRGATPRAGVSRAVTKHITKSVTYVNLLLAKHDLHELALGTPDLRATTTCVEAAVHATACIVSDL